MANRVSVVLGIPSFYSVNWCNRFAQIFNSTDHFTPSTFWVKQTSCASPAPQYDSECAQYSEVKFKHLKVKIKAPTSMQRPWWKMHSWYFYCITKFKWLEEIYNKKVISELLYITCAQLQKVPPPSLCDGFLSLTSYNTAFYLMLSLPNLFIPLFHLARLLLRRPPPVAVPSQ